ncbi:type I-E CRISPR-associated protein Cse1/CasA [Pigmentiphaga aceris]|uniref:Type I-E CRISPR-associated protein Cse1/CasA n=1 Tax=Pigmentiphaga aceris TaxID=1940612 RepID=A0A5C0B507_9BURK|nr:type I-E CRISPR-associated protein Cse1/CasA [Pigmentiphaga aceris]QEI07677.1 type I-E CRISPR-associated protein Cse1/CasA [Pigmentiphaga aceris]
MNTLCDPFLDVRTRDGDECRIRAVDVWRPDIYDLISPRPDFRAALFQYLIGVLQLSFAPAKLSDWKKYWDAPPTEAQLKAAFEPYLHAFELDTDKPAFMQDVDLLSDSEASPIAALLIESPGENTTKKNLDHFVHRGAVNGMCPTCAATALFTLQINAPSGGAGHRVSVRGGGPLTTLLMPRNPAATLWQKLWLNVIPKDWLGYPELADLSSVLPWMGPTRTSDPKGVGDTTPENVHPLQAYWSTPRRIRLDFANVQTGHCDLCGQHSETLLTQYRTRNYGTNYNGHWVHPLTPYSFDPKTLPLSIKGQKGGIGYRHWLGLAIGSDDAKPKAARVVEHMNSKQGKLPVKLWCFGYDMDNMKARCWYDSTLPFHNIESEWQLRHFAKAARLAIDVASESASLLGKYVKAARFNRPGDVASDAAVPLSFWQQSEPHFYALLEQLSQVDFDNEAMLAEPYQRWLRDTRKHALGLFDQWVQTAPIEDTNMRRVIQARADLVKWLHASKAMKPLRDIVNTHLKEAV